MLARGHALSGAVGWLAAAPLLEVAMGPLTTAQLAAGALVTAGAALAPDIDHPGSTIARNLGPAGRMAAGGVKLTLGHRGLTHSLACVALVGVASWWAVVVAGLLRVPSVLAGVTVGLAAHLLLRGTWTRVAPTAGVVAGVAVGGLLWSGAVAVGAWLPVALTTGVLLHIAGDALTSAGVPLFAPLRHRRVGMPVFGATGGLVESAVTAALAVAFVVLAVELFR